MDSKRTLELVIEKAEFNKAFKYICTVSLDQESEQVA